MLGSCCREGKMQSSGPILRSFANFYIEIRHFCCSLSAAKACIWNTRPDSKTSAFKMFFKTSQLAYGPHLAVNPVRQFHE